jgi:RNA polymerase sigma-70 factor (ECF subfamily)
MNLAEDMIPTRQSLLSRLRDWEDQKSWRDFFELYWKLIFKAALKAGLTPAEAEDVVQETILSVAKSMPDFKYDPAKGSFKGWLLRLTKWRVADQLRKRQPFAHLRPARADTGTETATVERVADPAGAVLEAVWDEEWESNLLETATQRIKNKVEGKQYQAFDLYAVKKWPMARITRTLQVNRGYVYLAKHRISGLIKKEINYLKKKPI